MRPSIIFIRHGESAANEQNVIGGHIDAGLTALGVQQAKEAGRRIVAAGLRFDEVHTSNLIRAWQTAELALVAAGQADVPTIRTQALAERDFGVFTGRNKNLIRKRYGYHTYEACMNSPHMVLPQAETFHQMYQRVADYYHKVLLPAAESGRRVLVVAHKYIIEMFALIVADIPPEEYFDVRLPNSKPMSEEQLQSYVAASTRLHKELDDRVVFHTTQGVALAALAGIALRLLTGTALSHGLFLALSVVLLAFISFFTMLGINSNHVTASRTFLGRDPYKPWLVRLGISGLLFWLFQDFAWSYLFLLGLMPPALSSPALSVLWGGEQYTAVRMTVTLSVLCAGLTALILGALPAGSVMAVGIFLAVFLLAFVLPAFLAQLWRQRQPIAAGGFALHWRWLGNLGLFAMAGVSMVRFTPETLADIWRTGAELGGFLWQGAAVLAMYLALRLLGHGVARLQKSRAKGADIYITHATPAVFLWMVFVSGQEETLVLGFWGCLFFFLGMWVDERYFVWQEGKENEQNKGNVGNKGTDGINASVHVSPGPSVPKLRQLLSNSFRSLSATSSPQRRA